ncbi:hypothetical protein PENTCL1PPCAC_20990, partial [Pristionchus entomophagus]
SGCTTALNSWHSVLAWFDGARICLVRPHFPLDSSGLQQSSGQLQRQFFDIATAQLSEIQTLTYEGPTSFWSSRNPHTSEFRPFKSLIIRVRSTLDNVWLFDLSGMVVRRFVIRSLWLPRSPLYALCHSITDDGKLFVYCSTERGGPLVRRRGLSRPIDPPHADHSVIVPLSGVLRLEELSSYRILGFIERDFRYDMLLRDVTKTDELLHMFGRKPYRA